MLRHMIKSKRLKILKKFYKRYKDKYDFTWKLEFESNTTDTLKSEPCVIVFDGKVDKEKSLFGDVICYNISI